MKKAAKLAGIVVGVAYLLLAGSAGSSAQDKKAKTKPEYIDAVAEGTGTQLGRIINVSIIIREYSTPEDQQALLAAFQEGGQKGLVNALSKMHSKGRIAITGTLGYDLNYIREFDTPEGRKIRFVTDRPITFGEAWSGSRSADYDLSAGEVNLSDEKGKSTGILAPLCRFTIDKEKGLQLELNQNPWKLANISVSK
jgi:gas vesicle protein